MRSLWLSGLPVCLGLASTWSWSELFGTEMAMNSTAPLGYFLRSMNSCTGSAEVPQAVPDMEGVSHFRLLPAIFPEGMGFHFDGLAMVLKFTFTKGRVEWQTKPYESDAEKSFRSCIFAGTGTGPTIGYHPCLTNPQVNLLPINDQLWLTTDTSKWGRMDPDTLKTLPDAVQVDSTVLNAHPACDPSSGACFVQYNCGSHGQPYTNQACVGILQANKSLAVQEISRATLPERRMIQHSHSPCITPNYLVSKLDSFEFRVPVASNSGLLRFMHQKEDDLWLVMDRSTNSSHILSGGPGFVNNHFWNCFESNGKIIVDSVAATENYLDNYFERNLAVDALNWSHIFHPPVRCEVKPKEAAVACDAFFADTAKVFDYPTFNPHFKMSASYRFFYAIAPATAASRWFDQLIKVDVQSRSVVKHWSAPGIFLTEADFVPSQAAHGKEDDGILVSILYNASDDTSQLGIFDAASLALLSQQKLGCVVPFHAHGIVCAQGKCFPNP
ncbi:unnamed protein product [Effrenium voratum]|nr:unnamed protein product [Effrenium voratum]